jgi:hypothetical protein
MDGAFIKILDESNTGWATVDSCANALMRVATDTNIVGRALGIVPDDWENAPKGFIDMDQDDFAKGSWMRQCQDLCMVPFGRAVDEVSVKQTKMNYWHFSDEDITIDPSGGQVGEGKVTSLQCAVFIYTLENHIVVS